jgi:hypothetical protein
LVSFVTFKNPIFGESIALTLPAGDSIQDSGMRRDQN